MPERGVRCRYCRNEFPLDELRHRLCTDCRTSSIRRRRERESVSFPYGGGDE